MASFFSWIQCCSAPEELGEFVVNFRAKAPVGLCPAETPNTERLGHSELDLDFGLPYTHGDDFVIKEDDQADFHSEISDVTELPVPEKFDWVDLPSEHSFSSEDQSEIYEAE